MEFKLGNEKGSDMRNLRVYEKKGKVNRLGSPSGVIIVERMSWKEYKLFDEFAHTW